MTSLAYHDDCLTHDTGPAHPERPDRLRAVVRALREPCGGAPLWDRLVPVAFEEAGNGVLARLHDPAYVERVRAACADGRAFLDTPDCPIVAATGRAARLAVGGAVACCDAVMASPLSGPDAQRNALVLARPPGHHAERDRAMGFCFFATAALAADHLVRVHGLSRVAVVDFDVHRGNGTQHLLEDRADVLFVSTHQDPKTLYPGTGFAHETGRGPGEGFTLNVPLAPGTGDAEARAAFTGHVLPALDRFAPQALVVSAGFDAAASDAISQLQWTTDTYAWIADALVACAARHAQGRLVAVLEGGYDLDALATGVTALAAALLDAP